MANNRNQDDDFDDIMSRIVKGGALPPPTKPTHAPEPKPRVPPRRTVPDHIAHPITAATTPAAYAKPAKPNKQRTKRPRVPKFVIILAVVIVGVLAGIGLYKGPLNGLFIPGSPFSKQTKTAYSFPLYYPTALPAGYAVNKDSITSPTSGVLVYSIAKGSKNIAVTMQKVPPGLSLNDLLASYTDVRKVTTDAVPAWVGLQDGKTLIAHMLTPQTWVIMTTDATNMSRADFETIIKSLRQG